MHGKASTPEFAAPHPWNWNSKEMSVSQRDIFSIQSRHHNMTTHNTKPPIIFLLHPAVGLTDFPSAVLPRFFTAAVAAAVAWCFAKT